MGRGRKWVGGGGNGDGKKVGRVAKWGVWESGAGKEGRKGEGVERGRVVGWRRKGEGNCFSVCEPVLHT